MVNLTMGKLTKRIDYTHLKPDATPEQIVQLCKEAKQYGFHSVCMNSRYVPLAEQQLKDSPVKACSVVGFPLGTMSTKAKVAEACQAIKDGATEIDMIIWIGGLKTGLDGEVKEDIRKVVEVCYTHKALCKVIIETCLLTAEEKERACNLVCGAGADCKKVLAQATLKAVE